MRGKTPPNSMPGTLVWTEPTVLRNSTGAVILGSKVSTCVGPPPSHSQTTEVLRVDCPAAEAAARARSRSDKARPPMPRAPTLRKSRRVVPSHALTRRLDRTFSMGVAPLSKMPREHVVRAGGQAGRWPTTSGGLPPQTAGTYTLQD